MKKINISELCWWLLLGALVVIIGKILIFDELKYYLHPKMNKFVITAEVILIILFIYQQGRIFSDSVKKFKLGYFIFLIPMFMLTLAGDAGAVIFENREINLNGPVRLQNPAPVPEIGEQSTSETAEVSEPGDSVYDRLPADEIDNPDPNATDPTDPASSGLAHIPGEQPLAIAEDPFLTTLFNLNEEQDGQEIMLEGFVYKNEFFKEDEFHISRMQMTCCVADAFLIGMIVRTPMAKEFANNDWVRVKGVTRRQMFKKPFEEEEKMILVLEAKEIERIEPLETPYVYY